MSEPMPGVSDAIQGALNEAVSAMSALNMVPEPIADPSGNWLSDRDAWAKHAVEHLHAAFELLKRAHAERERDRARILKLEGGIRSQQKNLSELAMKLHAPPEKCRCGGKIDLLVCNNCREY